MILIDSILTIGLHWGVLIVGALVWLAIDRKSFRPGWFLAALVIYAGYDFFLSRAFREIPNVIGEEWNWTGKLMAIAFALAVAALPAFGWRKVGLTLRQARGSWTAWAMLAALTAVFFYFAVTTGDGEPANPETIAFQWTMPGFDEELFYRGVLLVALNEAFRARANILDALIGWGGLMTSVLFGAAHALAWDDGALAFDLATFAMTGGPSLILLWLREKTGSIVMPIIGHNVANGAFTLF